MQEPMLYEFLARKLYQPEFFVRIATKSPLSSFLVPDENAFLSHEHRDCAPIPLYEIEIALRWIWNSRQIAVVSDIAELDLPADQIRRGPLWMKSRRSPPASASRIRPRRRYAWKNLLPGASLPSKPHDCLRLHHGAPTMRSSSVSPASMTRIGCRT